MALTSTLGYKKSDATVVATLSTITLLEKWTVRYILFSVLKDRLFFSRFYQKVPSAT